MSRKPSLAAWMLQNMPPKRVVGEGGGDVLDDTPILITEAIPLGEQVFDARVSVELPVIDLIPLPTVGIIRRVFVWLGSHVKRSA